MSGVETIPAPETSPPKHRPPAHACDTHSHVFGPFDRFPPRQASVYALPDAAPDVHARVRHALGMSRGVLIQPAPYADDASAIMNAVAGSNGALKGIAAAFGNVDDATLERWRAGGIVGLRFNAMLAPNGKPYPGSAGLDALRVLAPRMRALGLHAQIWASAATLAEELPSLVSLGLPLVLDHMGSPAIGSGVADVSFVRLLDIVRDQDVWAKLALCRVSKRLDDCADARPFHDALIDAAPGRCLWGSDWPYVRMTPAPDAGRLLDIFFDWTADAALQRRILVDNPARLFGFGGDT